MPNWGQLEFQDRNSPAISLVDATYDWVIVIVIFVVSLVLFVMVRSLFSSSWDLYFEDREILETLWSLAPFLTLTMVAAPSLDTLYTLESPSNNSQVLLKVLGNQWFWSYETVVWPAHLIPTDSTTAESVLAACTSTNPSLSQSNLMHPVSWYTGAPLSYLTDSYVSPTSGVFRTLDVDQSLVLPYKTDIRVLVSSSDVIHSWAIPSLGVKVDAVPGRLNQTFIVSTKLGHVYGQCSELCGVMHSIMPVKVVFVPAQTYLSYL